MRPHVSVFVQVHARVHPCVNYLYQGGPTSALLPLFKIIQICRPQLAKNTYFRPKIKMFSKKKKKKRSSLGIGLQNFYFCRKIIAFSKKKIAAACDQQVLCKIVLQARSWTTLTYIMTIPQRPHRPHDQFVTPYIDHFDPTWGRDP